jgi:hypothetical protein
MSFTAFLNSLRDAGTVPTRIDKTLMSKASGSQQSGMLAALRFLGLIDEAGKPKEQFKPLVLAQDDARKPLLEAIVRESYAFLFNDPEFDLHHASSGEMTQKFRNLGISGSTLTKTIAFFLSAAKEYGIPVSPHVKAPPPPKNGVMARKAAKVTEELTRESDGKTRDEDDGPDVERFEIPLPGKRSVKVIVPNSLDADDWEMLQSMISVYIKRWKGFKGNVS